MFRTPVNVTASRHKIHLQSPVLSIGSCFAQMIGQRLISNKFDAQANPFGTLFNPASIFRLLQEAVEQHLPPAESYLKRDDFYYNYLFHSDFTAPEQAGLEQQIQQALQATRDFLERADWLIVTLGTAYTYQRKSNEEIVANCHKMPADLFCKTLLSPQEIRMRFEQLLQSLRTINGKLRFIFTVSPVRHIRDTLTQNTVSKASLRLAIEQILEHHPEHTHYFPSYEIMMDDLRDYRFYEADMIHPTQVAEDYIWDKWTEAYLDDETLSFLPQWYKVSKALKHRSFHPDSAQHQKFISKTIEQLNLLSKKVDVSQEIEVLKKQLR